MSEKTNPNGAPSYGLSSNRDGTIVTFSMEDVTTRLETEMDPDELIDWAESFLKYARDLRFALAAAEEGGAK